MKEENLRMKKKKKKKPKDEHWVLNTINEPLNNTVHKTMILCALNI